MNFMNCTRAKYTHVKTIRRANSPQKNLIKKRQVITLHCLFPRRLLQCLHYPAPLPCTVFFPLAPSMLTLPCALPIFSPLDPSMLTLPCSRWLLPKLHGCMRAPVGLPHVSIGGRVFRKTSIYVMSQ